MAAQQCLFNVFVYGKPHKKRVRYKRPSYLKSYQFRVFNEDINSFQYYGDEKHILRIKTLHKLYSIIYGYCDVELFARFEKLEKNGLTIWGDDKQAEISNTWNLSLKDRSKLHIRLLRYLRKGFSVAISTEKIKNGEYKKDYKEYRAEMNKKCWERRFEKIRIILIWLEIMKKENIVERVKDYGN